jgi:DNA-binding transcriptional MerR regulator
LPLAGPDDEDDVERLRELLELRDLLGISLEELGELAAAESARASLRREWRAGIDDPVRRREVLDEARSPRSRQSWSLSAAGSAPAGANLRRLR